MEKKKNSIDNFWQVSSLEMPILPERKEAVANNVSLEPLGPEKESDKIEYCSDNCLSALIIALGKVSLLLTVIFY